MALWFHTNHRYGFSQDFQGLTSYQGKLGQIDRAMDNNSINHLIFETFFWSSSSSMCRLCFIGYILMDFITYLLPISQPFSLGRSYSLAQQREHFKCNMLCCVSDFWLFWSFWLYFGSFGVLFMGDFSRFGIKERRDAKEEEQEE